MSWKLLSHFQEKKLIIQNIPEPYFPPSIELEKEVDHIWKAQKKRLFNGDIFCLESIKNTKILGRFIPYKYFVAAYTKPELRKKLKLPCPLAVSGITTMKKNVLLGKRDPSLLSHRRDFETPPSGSIDKKALRKGRIDSRKQLYREFREEIGISTRFIKKVRFLGLLHSKRGHVYSLAFQLEVASDAILPKHTQEYSKLVWVPFNLCHRFMLKRRVVSLSKALLREVLQVD